MAPMVSCLLIDENTTERSRISGLLDELGVAAHQIADVGQGIRFCRENRPDVVLMEASALPRAKEFLRLVRYQCRNTGRPIVILYASETDVVSMGDSILSGASEFLMVPFDSELLRFKLTQSGVFAARAA
jgi:two-component system, chemotaxis family, chemotaxis protein CheY